MSYGKPPSFIANGTFVWKKLGYRYSEPPPFDLLAPQALASDDPWIAVAATLEQAKHGNHRPISALGKWMNKHAAPLLLGACTDLVGDAGTTKDLQILTSLMMSGEADYLRVEACAAARLPGFLWLASFMLNAWVRVRSDTDRDTISVMLSNMLEEEPGPIISNEEYSHEEYRHLVESRVKQLRDELGTDNVPVWRGKRFGVTSLAQQMCKMLRDSQEDRVSLGSSFIPLRHKFEASSGIDCCQFYTDGQFQPLSATAILEEFLQSNEAAKYKEGVRYFWGHLIPE